MDLEGRSSFVEGREEEWLVRRGDGLDPAKLESHGCADVGQKVARVREMAGLLTNSPNANAELCRDDECRGGFAVGGLTSSGHEAKAVC
jgi:hypothetical protein